MDAVHQHPPARTYNANRAPLCRHSMKKGGGVRRRVRLATLSAMPALPVRGPRASHRSAILWPALLLALWVFPGAVSAQEPYDVLCDARVEVYSCHPPHPRGETLTLEELGARLHAFGAGTIVVKLRSGDVYTSRTYKVHGDVLVVGGDSLRPKDILHARVKATWPEWSTVAGLALGGATFLGSVGLIVDGVQWIGGAGGDLGATGGGALLGAGLFGGLGILLARETYTVLVQEGWEQRVVEGAPARQPSPETLAGAR